MKDLNKSTPAEKAGFRPGAARLGHCFHGNITYDFNNAKLRLKRSVLVWRIMKILYYAWGDILPLESDFDLSHY